MIPNIHFFYYFSNIQNREIRLFEVISFLLLSFVIYRCEKIIIKYLRKFIMKIRIYNHTTLIS